MEVFSWVDLMYFTLGSIIIIGFLLSYYVRLSKRSNYKLSKVAVPIYNSKDVFSQEIVGESNFALTEKATSIWTRVTVYVLLVLMVTTSMYKLLGITGQYFYF